MIKNSVLTSSLFTLRLKEIGLFGANETFRYHCLINWISNIPKLKWSLLNVKCIIITEA